MIAKIKIITVIGLSAISSFTCKKAEKAKPKVTENKTIQASFLIKNGLIYDGTGVAPVRLDIGVNADTIVFLGDASKADIKANETIDATGLIITPGFIDPHTHCEDDLSSTDRNLRANLIYLRQGVTTVLTGNDGYGPLNPQQRINDWEENGIGTNVGMFVGFGNVRREVLGNNNVQPNATQLKSMKDLVANAMRLGAFGLSTGLSYLPQSYSRRSGTEVKELAMATEPWGGVYDTHLRSQGSGVLDAIKEVEEIAVYNNKRLKVHISHIKVGPSKNFHLVDNMITQMNTARSNGINITANVYPYLASGDGLRGLVPSSYRTTLALYQNNYNDVAKKAVMYNSVKNTFIDIGETVEEGADLIYVVSEGKTIWELAQEQSKDPVNVVLDMLYRSINISIITHGQSEDVMKKFLGQSYIVTGSDGGRTHPRGAGSFPQAIKKYSVDGGVQTLTQAIHTSSGLTAEIFGIKKRGVLKVGNFADIVILDIDNYRANATYDEPELYATGVKRVFLNGYSVVENDRFVGTLAGKGIFKNK